VDTSGKLAGARARSLPSGIRSPLDLYANLPTRGSNLPTIAKLLQTSLSAGTWAGRTRVARHFLSIKQPPLRTLDHMLEQRLATVAPATVSRDIGHLKWLLPRLLTRDESEPLIQLLQDLQRGVRKVDPGRPLSKALPFTPTTLRMFLAAAPLPIRAMALLAFRTASRVSDLLHIRRRDLAPMPDGLMVTFTVTKTNQEAERRADHRILVPDPPPDIFRHAQHLQPSQLLFTPAHRAQLRQMLYKVNPLPTEVVRWRAQDPQNKVRDRYTLHSFKRGAAALAWQGVVDRRITLQDLMLLLKHQDVKSALEYCPCPVLAAKAAGSTAAVLTAI